jgi:hypothetical protein
MEKSIPDLRGKQGVPVNIGCAPRTHRYPALLLKSMNPAERGAGDSYATYAAMPCVVEVIRTPGTQHSPWLRPNRNQKSDLMAPDMSETISDVKLAVIYSTK